ncbi:MAG TPA: RCC1 domain-containing protein, partial [Polyangia bacterium]
MRATGNGVFSQCLVGTLAAALTAAITPACGGASERPVGRNPPSRPAGLDAAQPALDARSIEDMNASDLTTSETGRPEMSPTTQDAAVVDDASDPSADAGVDASDTGQRPRVVQITAGRDHTCVLIDDGRVKCWGRNSDGQLGLG